MGEWQDRQVGYGAICSMAFWVSGVALILAAIAELVTAPYANLGNVLFMIGSLRTVLAVLRAKFAETAAASDAFELGRATADLKIIRD